MKDVGDKCTNKIRKLKKNIYEIKQVSGKSTKKNMKMGKVNDISINIKKGKTFLKKCRRNYEEC